MNYTDYLDLKIQGVSFTWELKEVMDDTFKFQLWFPDPLAVSKQ